MDQNLEQTKYLRTLRRKIVAHFSLGEFKVICSDVQVNYDELPGEELIEKTLNLINYLIRRGRLADLIQLLGEERPKVNWNEQIPSPEQQMQDAEKLIPPAKDDLILREYLEKLERYLPPDSFENAKSDSKLRKIIHALTLTYMQQLDLWRRTRLVRHIGENNLQTIISLATVDLSGADLSDVNLQGVNLQYAKLNNSFLANCNLKEANLVDADLQEAFLMNSDLRKADLRGAKLKNAVFTNSNLQNVNLKNARIMFTDFRGADLRGSQLDENENILHGFRTDQLGYIQGTLLDNPFWLRERAREELHRGNFNASLEDCNQLCMIDQGDGWIFFLRGVSYKALHEEDLASKDLKEALRLPENEKHLYLLYRAVLGDIDDQSIQKIATEYTYHMGTMFEPLIRLGLNLILNIFSEEEIMRSLKKEIDKNLRSIRRRGRGYEL